MTVHGAKGLEAPLVILADTTSAPQGPRPPRLLALPAQRAAPGTPDRMVWASRKETDAQPMADARQRARNAAEDEYRRLLYVAMTRAADRLIVAGFEGGRARLPGCWYDLILEGLRDREGFETVGEGEAQIWRYRRVTDTTPAPPAEPRWAAAGTPASSPWPAWLRRNAPAEPERPVAITPSEGDDTMPSERLLGSGEGRAVAIARGLLIHRLMQSLPDIAPARRAAAARRHVARVGRAFTAAEQDAFVATTLRLLDEPRFAALFSPGSRAEVPIVGRLVRPGKSPLLVSGQIDRLAVTPAAVLIGDYKTNRPAPRTLAQVPPAYVRQLALYRAVLAKLYPDRPVRAVLIWTDVPDLMELSAEVLDAETARLTSV